MARINTDDMNELFAGLTSPSATTSDATNKEIVETPKKSSKKAVSNKEKICTNVSSEKMDKIRAIADKECITVTSFLDAALEMAINIYEQKNGVVRVKAVKKGDVSKLF